MAGSDAPRLIPVVLAGGRGTRLWPLSSDDVPKQFLPLLSSESLFEQTLLRASALRDFTLGAPIVVGNSAHRELLVSQARAVGIEPACVVLEPAGRNTAPAIALAAMLARRGGGDDALLLVMPADHVIGDSAAFAAAVHSAAEAAAAERLVTFGVVPDKPETGYGYIQRGEVRGAWADIRRFVEKPDLQTAESYLRSGDYFWNSGMFVFSAARILGELRAHAPAVLAGSERAFNEARSADNCVELGAAFRSVPSISIDYAVMEKTANGAVVPLAADWSDVGSWTALHEHAQRDEQGNSTRGEVLLESCTNTFAVAGKRLIAAVGVEDLVIVETDEAVLVMRRERAQDVSRIVARLEKARNR